jgi:hypothetical protein
MRRRNSQLGFADLALSQSRPRKDRRDTLLAIDGLIDWSPIGQILLAAEPERKVGRPGYPALSLFKALLLQSWYGLSDPGLEDALADRVSFRRFVGLSWGMGRRIIRSSAVSVRFWRSELWTVACSTKFCGNWMVGG